MRLRCELHMCPCGFHLNGAQFATRSVSAKHFRFDNAKDQTHMMAAVKLSSQIVLQSKFGCDLKSNPYDGEIFIQNSPSKSKILCGNFYSTALLHFCTFSQKQDKSTVFVATSGDNQDISSPIKLLFNNNISGGTLGKNIARGKMDPEIDSVTSLLQFKLQNLVR